MDFSNKLYTTVKLLVKSFTIVCFVLMGYILSSCQEPLDFIYDGKLDPVLMVEGKITTDTTAHYVILSQTILLANSEPVWETGADVSITSSKEVIPLLENSEMPGHYYTSPDVFGVIGETYQLNIRLENGEEYNATTSIQNIPEIDSVKFIWEDTDGYGYYGHYLYYHGWELEEEGNAYLWNVYLDDTLYNDTLWKTTFVDDNWVNGRYIGIESKQVYDADSGKYITIEKSNFAIYGLEPDEVTTDTINVLVEMESIPLDYYDFWISIMSQTVWTGGPFDPARANPINNLSNGAMGYFYGASVLRKSFVYYPPEESKGFENPEF